MKADMINSRTILLLPNSTMISDRPNPIPVTFSVPMTMPAAAPIMMMSRTA